MYNTRFFFGDFHRRIFDGAAYLYIPRLQAGDDKIHIINKLFTANIAFLYIISGKIGLYVSMKTALPCSNRILPAFDRVPYLLPTVI